MPQNGGCPITNCAHSPPANSRVRWNRHQYYRRSTGQYQSTLLEGGYFALDTFDFAIWFPFGPGYSGLNISADIPYAPLRHS